MSFQDLCLLHNFQWEKHSPGNQFSTCIYEFLGMVCKEEIITLCIFVCERKTES